MKKSVEINVIKSTTIGGNVTQINKVYNFGSVTLVIVSGLIILSIGLVYLLGWKPYGNPYWCSEKTGVTHKKGCVHYARSKGYYTRFATINKQCKKCF